MNGKYVFSLTKAQWESAILSLIPKPPAEFGPLTWSFDSDWDLTATAIMSEPVAVAAAPIATPVVVAPIKAIDSLVGKIIDGFEFTHYGYPGDSWPDSNSMRGIGDRDNKLTPLLSVALTEPARLKLFGVAKPSTEKRFTLGGFILQDDDQAPEKNLRVDIYDPFYVGIDEGCTPAMHAKSKAEMVAAGILPA